MSWPSRDASGSFGLSTAMMTASAGQESCAAGRIQPFQSQGICRGRTRGEYRSRRVPTDVRQETNINRVPDGGTENSPQERASSDAAACRGNNSASLLRSEDSKDARSLAPPRDLLPRSDSTFQCDLAITVGDDEDPTARSPLGASDSSGDDGQSLAVSVGVAPGRGSTTLIPKDLLTDGHHGDARFDVLQDRHHGADHRSVSSLTGLRKTTAATYGLVGSRLRLLRVAPDVCEVATPAATAISTRHGLSSIGQTAAMRSEYHRGSVIRARS
jgi:hypothetical protein